MIVRSNYGGPSSARCDCPDEAGDVHYPKCPQSASSAGLAYPREQVGAKTIEAFIHWEAPKLSDERVAEILKGKAIFNQRLIAASQNAFAAQARTFFSAWSKKGPRWTRDGFNCCQGLTYEKWLRFLSLGYEQTVMMTRILPLGTGAVTEVQVDAALAASGAK